MLNYDKFLRTLYKSSFECWRIKQRHSQQFDRIFTYCRPLGNLARHSWGTVGAQLGHSWGTKQKFLGHSWGTVGEKRYLGHSWGTVGAQLRQNQLGHSWGTVVCQLCPNCAPTVPSSYQLDYQIPLLSNKKLLYISIYSTKRPNFINSFYIFDLFNQPEFLYGVPFQLYGVP